MSLIASLEAHLENRIASLSEERFALMRNDIRSALVRYLPPGSKISETLDALEVYRAAVEAGVRDEETFRMFKHLTELRGP